MRGQPSGTVTFLFSDIQGSTRLWDEDPLRMEVALLRHDKLIHEIVTKHLGFTFKTVGDQFCVVFQRAADAVLAAIDIQKSISAETWDLPWALKVRIGIHTGDTHERDGDYYGQTVNRVARIEAAAHGEQIVVSEVAYQLARDRLEPTIQFSELGEHRLKDLSRPDKLYQVNAPELPTVEFPAPRSLNRHLHNLPVQTTPFIGRGDVLAKLASQLRDPGYRIVSVVGPGGMGKTRLALQVAVEVIEVFPDGVWFVDLSGVWDESDLLKTIAEALPMSAATNAVSADQIATWIEDKQLLLVLDNFEQVVEHADVVSSLAAKSANAVYLITSRIALRLRGERILELDPLPSPPKDLQLDHEHLTAYDSVRLFIERAEAADSGFQVNNYNAPAVAEICSQLDGIPLAIELAANRTRLLQPEELLKRLGERLELLSGGSRDLPPRQRTLRRTIDWSFDLLDEQSARAFLALGAFDGLIRLSAAEAVLGTLGFSLMHCLNALQNLVEQSLVLRTPLDEEQPVFGMLASIQEYVRERLDKSELRITAHDAHANHFLELSKALFPGFDTPLNAEQLRAGWAEMENLQKAFRWFLESGQTTQAAVLVRNFSQVLITKGRANQASRNLAELDIESLDPDLAIGIACRKAHTAIESGLLDQASASLVSVKELVRPTEDASDLDYFALRARIATRRRDPAAPAIYAELLTEAGKRNSAWMLGHAHIGLGRVAMMNGNLNECLQHNQSAEKQFQLAADERGTAMARCNLGLVHYLRHEYDLARTFYETAVGVLTSEGDVMILLQALANLAMCQLSLGEPEAAMLRADHLQTLAHDCANPRMQRLATGLRAECMVALQRPTDALQTVHSAFQSAAQEMDSPEDAYLLRVRADAYLASGERQKAAEDYDRAIPLLAETGDTEELDRARRGLAITQSGSA